MPTRMPRSEPRRGVLGPLAQAVARAEPAAGAAAPRRATSNGAEHFEQERGRARRRPAPRPRPKDPRHVRAVPTTAQAKVDRALELFNGSSHQRTVAGLARTLGDAVRQRRSRTRRRAAR